MCYLNLIAADCRARLGRKLGHFAVAQISLTSTLFISPVIKHLRNRRLQGKERKWSGIALRSSCYSNIHLTFGKSESRRAETWKEEEEEEVEGEEGGEHLPR